MLSLVAVGGSGALSGAPGYTRMEEEMEELYVEGVTTHDCRWSMQLAAWGIRRHAAQPLHGGTLTHPRTATAGITECVPEPILWHGLIELSGTTESRLPGSVGRRGRRRW